MIFDMQIVAHAIAIVNAMRSGQLANLTVMLFSQWMQVARQVEEQS
ncbi:succinate dehydrogenase flavoprotein subunit [Pantoea agglomerans]